MIEVSIKKMNIKRELKKREGGEEKKTIHRKILI